MTHPFLNLIISLTQQILSFLRRLGVTAAVPQTTNRGERRVPVQEYTTATAMMRNMIIYLSISVIANKISAMLEKKFTASHRSAAASIFLFLFLVQINYLKINHFFFFNLPHLYRSKSSWCYRGYPCRGATALARGKNDNKMFHGTLPGIRFNKSH